MNIIQGITALLESALAVILAVFTDLGYWALVIAMLVQLIVNESIIFMVSKWRPKFIFSKESFSYLFRFGINGLGFSVTNYLRQNLDYLLVGRLLGTYTLGLYEFAYRIPHLIQNRISRPVGSVVFPSFSKIQDDNRALVRGYCRVVKYVSLISFPLLFGLAAVAHLAVPIVWGDQWLPIITPLRLLCLCAALRIAVQPLGAVFNCKNRPDLPFKISSLSLVWTAFVVGGLGFYYGVNGVALGMILSVFPGYISICIAFRMIDGSPYQLLKSVWPVFTSSLFCALSAYSVSILCKTIALPVAVSLLISILTGAVFYILTILLVFPDMAKEAVGLFEDISGKKITGRWLKEKVPTK